MGNKKSFLDWYNLLPDEYKRIIKGTLVSMEHTDYLPSNAPSKHNYWKIIQEKQKELGLTDNDVCAQICSEYGVDLSVATYQNLRARNTQNSVWLECFLDILGITPMALLAKDEKSSTEIIESGQRITNIEWLYNSLDESNKRAADYLAMELYIMLTVPESADNDDDL